MQSRPMQVWSIFVLVAVTQPKMAPTFHSEPPSSRLCVGVVSHCQDNMHHDLGCCSVKIAEAEFSYKTQGASDSLQKICSHLCLSLLLLARSTCPTIAQLIQTLLGMLCHLGSSLLSVFLEQGTGLCLPGLEGRMLNSCPELLLWKSKWLKGWDHTGVKNTTESVCTHVSLNAWKMLENSDHWMCGDIMWMHWGTVLHLNQLLWII